MELVDVLQIEQLQELLIERDDAEIRVDNADSLIHMIERRLENGEDIAGFRLAPCARIRHGTFPGALP